VIFFKKYPCIFDIQKKQSVELGGKLRQKISFATLISLQSTIGGHRHRSQCRRYPTSDIDICYSDIGDKYVGLKNVIPISEVFQYRHQSSFQYPTLKKKDISLCRFERTSLETESERFNTKLRSLSVCTQMSDIGYRIKVYFDILYNVGLRSLSPISEVPISGSVRYR
jgi:hypothetical protein